MTPAKKWLSHQQNVLGPSPRCVCGRAQTHAQVRLRTNMQPVLRHSASWRLDAGRKRCCRTEKQRPLLPRGEESLWFPTSFPLGGHPRDYIVGDSP